MPFTAKSVQAPARQVYVGDIDQDSQLELVYSCLDGRIICQDEATGSVKWTYLTDGIPFQFCAYDIDGDGELEIFVASGDGQVYAINSDGTARWTLAIPDGYPLYAIAAGVFDGGRRRIITGGTVQRFYSIRDNGSGQAPTIRGTFNAVTYMNARYVANIVCLDTNNDGVDSIILGSATGRLVCWDMITSGASADTITSPTNRLWLLDQSGWTITHISAGTIPFYGLVVFSTMGLPRWRLMNATTGAQISGTGSIPSHYAGATIDGHTIIAHNAAMRTGRTANSNDIVAVIGPDIHIYSVDPGTGAIALLESAIDSTNTASQRKVWNSIFAYRPPVGTDVLYLASAPSSNNDRVYKLEFDASWTSAVTSLAMDGQLATINSRIDNLLTATLAATPQPRINSTRPMFLLTAGTLTPGTLSAMQTQVAGLAGGVVVPTRTEFGEDTWAFAMSIVLTQTGWGTTWGDGIDWPSDGVILGPSNSGTSVANLLALIDTLENLTPAGAEFALPYWIRSGNNLQASVSLDTLGQLFARANTTAAAGLHPPGLQGLLISETEDVDYEDTTVYFQRYIQPALALCVTHGKRLLANEKRAFWPIMPARSEMQAILGNDYSDIVIPHVEDSNTTISSVAFAARVGMGVGGFVKQIGDRAIEDMWRWSVQHDYAPMSSHQLYRVLLRAIVCGMSVMDVKSFWRSSVTSNYTFLGQKIVRLVCAIVDKGILSVPAFSQLRNISPIRLTMTQPDATFIREVTSAVAQSNFWQGSPPPQNLDAVLGYHTEYRVGANTPTYSIANYLYGQRRQITEPIPVTRYGLPVIIPNGTPPNAPALNFDDEVLIDGNTLTYAGQTYGATAGRSVIEPLFAAAVSSLPFTQNAEARVFMMCYEVSATSETVVYDMVIMDAEWNESVDQTATITVNTDISDVQATDKITGDQMAVNGSSFDVPIPAGGVVILSVVLQLTQVPPASMTLRRDGTMYRRSKKLDTPFRPRGKYQAGALRPHYEPVKRPAIETLDPREPGTQLPNLVEPS